MQFEIMSVCEHDYSRIIKSRRLKFESCYLIQLSYDSSALLYIY
ncbi:unnamed protein product, partial [Larinioides sclopetarius]